jgi:hypothetical protein
VTTDNFYQQLKNNQTIMEENKKELQSLLTRLGEIVPTLLFIGANADKQGALLIGSPEKTDEERKFDLVATVAMMMDQRAELREIILSAVSWFMQENPMYRDAMRLALKKLEELDEHQRTAEPHMAQVERGKKGGLQ